MGIMGIMGTVGKMGIVGMVGFCLGAGLANRCNHHRGSKVTTDTIRVTVDTIRDNTPKAKDSVVVDEIRVPVVNGRDGGSMGFIGSMGKEAADTAATASDARNVGKIGVSDTVWAVVPRTQKRYEDSTYTAWVSGYEPRLDSIRVYRKTTFVVKSEERRVKNGRLAVGLAGGFGYGVFTRKPDLFVGVGVTWRLW